MNPASFCIAALALCSYQQSAGGGNVAAAVIAHAIINRSASEGVTLEETIEIVNRTAAADPLTIPDPRDPAWITHLRNIDDVYFGEAQDPTGGGTHWVDMSVPSPIIPAGMGHVARVGKFSFFQ